MRIIDGSESPRDPLSRCDSLNAQLMRWRLRKHFPVAGNEEQKRLMEMIADLGKITPAMGVPVPPEAKTENLAASVVLTLQPQWESGNLTGFSEGDLSFAVLNHILEQHRYHHPGPRAVRRDPLMRTSEAVDLSQVAGPAEGGDGRPVWQDLYPHLYRDLDKDEAYVFAWLIAVGKHGGAQRQAAHSIDRSDRWAHDRSERIAAKIRKSVAADPETTTMAAIGPDPGEDDSGTSSSEWVTACESVGRLGKPQARRAVYEILDRDEAYLFGWLLAFRGEPDREGLEDRAAVVAGKTRGWVRSIAGRVGRIAERGTGFPS